METHTTTFMREIAGTIAMEITEQGKSIGVDECYVDDFGRYGNFQLICSLDMERNSSRNYKACNRKTFSLLKIVYLFKRVIKQHKGAILRCHESPQGIYKSNASWGGKPDFEGYERNYIMIDIDFIPYHAESNSFAVQTQIVEMVSDKQLKMF